MGGRGHPDTSNPLEVAILFLRHKGTDSPLRRSSMPPGSFLDPHMHI